MHEVSQLRSIKNKHSHSRPVTSGQPSFPFPSHTPALAPCLKSFIKSATENDSACFEIRKPPFDCVCPPPSASPCLAGFQILLLYKTELILHLFYVFWSSIKL